MLTKRVIPCLDVRNGRLTKGVKFVGNEDIGDPVETARQYYEAGADEIVFYDITASAEARGIFLDVVEKVASEIFIPFSGGRHPQGTGHAGRAARGRGKDFRELRRREAS